MGDWSLGFGLQLVAMLGLLAASFLRGAAPERFMAMTLATIFCVDVACGPHLPQVSVAGERCMRLILDIAAFSAILAVALKAHRVYPLWLGGLQISKLVADLLHVYLAKPTVAVLVVMNHAAFNLQLGVLTIGLVCHLRRQRVWTHPCAVWEA